MSVLGGGEEEGRREEGREMEGRGDRGDRGDMGDMGDSGDWVDCTYELHCVASSSGCKGGRIRTGGGRMPAGGAGCRLFKV